MREFFFDDDTFTDDLPRAEEIARRLGKLGLNWSCNAKANVPRKTLEIMKDNGLRLLLVGYESGNDQILINIKKGVRIDIAREFSRNARDLGIKIHGTFILGLPGETTETIQQTIKFACDIDPETIQVSLAAPYPGTELYRQAQEQGWLQIQTGELVDAHGIQTAAMNYPKLSSTVIFNSVEELVQEILFPAAEDVLAVRRNAARSGSDEAAGSRGRRILQVPARAQGDGARNGGVRRGDRFERRGLNWISVAQASACGGWLRRDRPCID